MDSHGHTHAKAHSHGHRHASGAGATPSAVAAVALERVSLALGQVKVLDGVTMRLEQGEFVAVLGPNGAGKSTLMQLVGGVLRPDSGTVRLFGQEPDALGPKRRLIGYMPQAGQLQTAFPVTAGQVVMMGRYAGLGPGRYPGKDDRLAVAQAMETTGVADLARQSIGALSGGQRQRVMLARALVNGPQLLLLDEPAAGMDAPSIERFYELLQERHRAGVAIMLVSHDIGVVSSYVDRVACLNTRLVAHGRPDEVLGSEALEEMYGCNAMFFSHGHSPHMVVGKHGK